MSKITKYLHQDAIWEKRSEELNDYGAPVFEPIQHIQCRKRRYIKDVLTSTGSTIQSSSVYLVDDTVGVSIGDLLDSRPVVLIEDYVNASGVIEGYKVIV